jgi:TPR repeat protein
MPRIARWGSRLFLNRHISVCWRASFGDSAAQLVHGKHLAAAGRNEAAVHQFLKAAHAGIAAAAFQLGRCYLLGLGVSPCLETALIWLTRAAEQQETDTQLVLASLALQGISTKPTKHLLVVPRLVV